MSTTYRCRIFGIIFPANLLIAIAPLLGQVRDNQDRAAGWFSRGFQEPVVSVTAHFTASTDRKPARLSITAAIEPTWHIYSITQPAGGPLPTQIKLQPSEAFRFAGAFQCSPTPERKPEPAFDNLIVETHHSRVTWQAPIEIDSRADPATLKIEGGVRIQACSPNNCLPPQEIPFTATLVQTALSSGETPAEMKPIAVDPQQLAGRQTQDCGTVALDPMLLQSTADNELNQMPLALVMGLGFLGGLILNLMPCVLPVIGLKILSFVEQAGHSRRQTLVLNIWYSLGLLSVFLVLASLAVFMSLGWGQMFSYTAFNVTLAAVVFTMGLSFLDVWEIPIPGFVGSGKANDLSQQEGAVGAFSKGVLTTILATPCSGPFLGAALAWAVGQPPAKTYAVFTSVGVGMASPYLLIGAFPKLICFLPKPGAWMGTLKQVMGFVLLGTVAYLLTLVPWALVVPTVAFLFGLWAACWWIGRMPATSGRGRKAKAWLSAAVFAGAVWLVAFGWLAEVMAGRFQRTLQTAGTTSDNRPAGQGNDELHWQPFSRQVLDELIASQKTVLVDFTADWCMTCKTLEKLVLNTPQTCGAVRRNGIVTLQADWTHGSPEVTEMLDLLGSRQVPVIAIFPAGDPHRPVILRGAYTQQSLLAALEKAGPSQSPGNLRLGKQRALGNRSPLHRQRL